jgi:hypothetical protein
VLNLVSGSLAEDAGYQAAADIAVVCADLGIEYRLIGGLASALIHAAHGAPGDVPPRQTADADLGADDLIVAAAGLKARLLAQGYRRSHGNRFVAGEGDATRTIDVLVPAPGPRLLGNISCGPLVVDAIPGLRLAFAVEPLTLSLAVRLSTGAPLVASVEVPQVIPALVLKAYAFAARITDRDLLDLWRLLETAHALGLTSEDWRPIHAQKRDALPHLESLVLPAASVGANIARRQRWPHPRIAALARAQIPHPAPGDSHRAAASD